MVEFPRMASDVVDALYLGMWWKNGSCNGYCYRPHVNLNYVSVSDVECEMTGRNIQKCEQTVYGIRNTYLNVVRLSDFSF
jgi:hypothetical protein